MVELVFFKIKAAYQRPDRPIPGVQGDESPFHFWQLGNFPRALGGFCDPNQGPTANLDVGRGLVGQARLGGFESFTRDFDAFTVVPKRQNPFRIGLQHNRRHDVTVVRTVGQRIFDGFLGFTGICWKFDKLFWATVNLTPLVVHDALAQGLVRHGLVGRLKRRVDVQSAGIGLVAVLVEHQLPDGLCNVLGVYPSRIGS